MAPTYLIIGGDAAGMSAASKAKRNMPDAHVIVLERGPHISYSACGMPYWIGGTIESDRKLMILTPERARDRRGIDVRIGHEAVSIDPEARTVEVVELQTGHTFTQPYDELVIATGAATVWPPIPGVGEDVPGLFVLRTLQDGQRIFAHLEQNSPRSAVIIGGGYIGVEMAEGLRERGLEVTIVEMLPQLMPQFDAEMVDPVVEHIAEKGVRTLTRTTVTALEREAGADGEGAEGAAGFRVLLEGHDASVALEPLTADMVLLATGVRPRSELAAAAGIRVGETGAIWVDEQMRTSAPHVYAAGDCAEHYHRVLEKNAWIPLAPAANRGGRVAGDNMSGGDSAFPGVIGTAVVKVFDYTMAVTGLTELLALETSDPDAVGSATIESYEKARYWPGAEKIRVKLVFRKRDGRVLGGQIVGRTGVSGRINVVAAAVTAGMTVAEVGMLDLAYAPPYAPTYDPIQVCANVALRNVG